MIGLSALKVATRDNVCRHKGTIPCSDLRDKTPSHGSSSTSDHKRRHVVHQGACSVSCVRGPPARDLCKACQTPGAGHLKVPWHMTVLSLVGSLCARHCPFRGAQPCLARAESATKATNQDIRRPSGFMSAGPRRALLSAWITLPDSSVPRTSASIVSCQV